MPVSEIQLFILVWVSSAMLNVLMLLAWAQQTHSVPSLPQAIVCYSVVLFFVYLQVLNSELKSIAAQWHAAAIPVLQCFKSLKYDYKKGC